MKSLSRKACIRAIFTALLLCTPVFGNLATASPLLSGDTPEVVVFFSYHCGECQQLHAYTSAWAHLNPDVKVKRVPVFGNSQEGQWRFGARLFFLLEQAQSKFPLSPFERQQAAFNLTQQLDTFPTTAEGFESLFRDYGMEFSNIEFIQWWNKTEVMMISARDVLSEVEKETGGQRNVPFIRVSSKGKVNPTYIFKDDPVKMIQQINGVLHED